jgi:hypothetical protein
MEVRMDSITLLAQMSTTNVRPRSLRTEQSQSPGVPLPA